MNSPCRHAAVVGTLVTDRPEPTKCLWCGIGGVIIPDATVPQGLRIEWGVRPRVPSTPESPRTSLEAKMLHKEIPMPLLDQVQTEGLNSGRKQSECLEGFDACFRELEAIEAALDDVLRPPVTEMNAVTTAPPRSRMLIQLDMLFARLTNLRDRCHV